MNHLTWEELTEVYYGERPPSVEEHLSHCEECWLRLGRLEEILGSVSTYPVPEPEPGFEGRTWSRLLPHLSPAKSKRAWFLQWWTLGPAFAALLVLAFAAGVLTQQRRQLPGMSAQARERVLLISLGDHLDRSQVLLAELSNAPPGVYRLAGEQKIARDLLDENRLLRQASNRTGETSRGALLEDLERLLLDIANGPADLSASDLQELQKRIDDQGLLFKVRITGTDLRREGREL
jgi:hypothetical protein